MGYSYFLTRISHIIACLYLLDAEIVEDIENDECYIFLGMDNNRIYLVWEEIDCLLQNNLIEIESGCDEPGHETKVYKLTDLAIIEIRKTEQKQRS